MNITKFHVIYSSGWWKWYKEGLKHAYLRSKDKSVIMVAAVYRIALAGGDLIVHKEDGSVDFILDNWSD